MQIKPRFIAILVVSAIGGMAIAAHPEWRPSKPWETNDDSPRIDFDGTTLRMEDTAEQQKIVFPIRNTGRRRLVVHELDLKCGCGEQFLQTIIIPPGESRQIVLERSDRDLPVGEKIIASFVTSDPQLPRLDLSIQAAADGRWSIRPVPGHEIP